MIYAKTLPPEWADPRDLLDLFENDYVICGNDRLIGLNADLYAEARREYDKISENEGSEVIYAKDGSMFSDETMRELEEVEKCGLLELFLVKYFSAFFGQPYDLYTLRGCCQGDWNYLYAPANLTRNEERYVEAVYFNLGTALEIDCSGEDIEDADSINGYGEYTVETDADGIKEYVAEICGVPIDEVTLFMFNDWERRARYIKG